MAYTGHPREEYKRNRKQKTSGKKHSKALKAVKKTEAQIKKEGDSKMLQNQLAKANAKLKKYGLKK